MKMLSSKMAMTISLASGLIGGMATADVLVDYNPGTGTYGGVWYNECCDHYYAEDVTFEEGATIDGLDIYTDWASFAGGDYMVSIWLDNGFGEPGDLWMQWEQAGTDVTEEVYDGITFWRHAVDFDAIELEPGQTYWIGMTSVAGWHLGQTSLLAPDDGLMAWFQGDSFYAFTSVGDMSFRLRGTVGGGGGLSATFDCPIDGGVATFRATGGTPGGRAAIVYGTNPGPWDIPNNNPCAGTTLSVAPPFLPGAPRVTNFDAAGELELSGNVPRGLCDRLFIEVIDLTTCDTATP